jgi:hypothetical protein
MVITSGRSRQVCAGGSVCLLLLSSIVFWTCNGKETPVVGAEPTGTDTPLNRGLRILYAGRPGSDREKDFVSFLKKHFDVVGTGDLRTFQEADTLGFDVTLMDWDPDVFDGPRPQISEGFTRPVITIGVPGAWICWNRALKTGYL